MGPKDWGPGEAIGAPEHPHRGFETVTYLLQGEMVHEDSTGTAAHLAPGGVQWMTAGRGVIHSELPSPNFLESGGTLHGFQLWVNLPADQKMTPARYQGITPDQMPLKTGDGFVLRLIGGELLGLKSSVQTALPITYAHISLAPGAELPLPLPEGQEAHLYPFLGDLFVNQVELTEGFFGSLETLESVLLRADSRGCECLFLAARPLREPMTRYGPFVMNYRHELLAAIDDFQQGRLVQPPLR